MLGRALAVLRAGFTELPPELWQRKRELVTGVYGFAPDSFEVAEAFEVPLDYLFDPANHQTRSRDFNGRRRTYYVFEYRNRLIWGATAGMLMNLYRRVSGEA